MIRTVRHRGLKRLIEAGDASRLTPHLVPRIRRIITVLDAAGHIEEVDVPGFVLHRLSGDLAGFWAVRVSGNWRIVFRFADGDVLDVDLVDYH